MEQGGTGGPAKEEPLTIHDFDQHIGEDLAVDTEGGSLVLRLALVQHLPPSPREGGSFRLEFAGPAQPILPQAIYSFPIGDARRDIFIVPVGPEADGDMRYEAIFF